MKKNAAPKKTLKKNSGPSPDFDGPESAVVSADGAGAADALPGKEEIAAVQSTVRAFMNGSGQSRVRVFLDRLSPAPPQVLLLEGGTANERLAAAHYWALLLNCPAVNGRERPAPGRRQASLANGPPAYGPEAVSGPDARADAPPASEADGVPASAQGGLMALLTSPPQGGQAAKTSRSASLGLGLPGLEASAPARRPASEQAERDAESLPPGALAPAAGPSRFLPPDADFSPPSDAGAARTAAPCLECPECIRMLTHLHRDCFFFDGLAGSIKIDEVRAMRAVLGEPAREARCRIVILREAQSLVEAAANALLKSLEEPRPGTSFILLAPQRERLLPTLVSRSFVLTLPWPWEEDAERRDLLAPWEAALCSFMKSGRDLFERSAGKGSVDAALVHELAGLCRRALARRISALQSGAPPGEGLESLLARLPAQRLRMLDEALAECQDSLIYNVNPTLVLEWLATRMFLLLPRSAARL